MNGPKEARKTPLSSGVIRYIVYFTRLVVKRHNLWNKAQRDIGSHWIIFDLPASASGSFLVLKSMSSSRNMHDDTKIDNILLPCVAFSRNFSMSAVFPLIHLHITPTKGLALKTFMKD